jgi:hypothetical protein
MLGNTTGEEKAALMRCHARIMTLGIKKRNCIFWMLREHCKRAPDACNYCINVAQKPTSRVVPKAMAGTRELGGGRLLDGTTPGRKLGATALRGQGGDIGLQLGQQRAGRTSRCAVSAATWLR